MILFFFSPSIFWFGCSTGDRTGMGPRNSQPLALLLMPCSKTVPHLTPKVPHCPSFLTPSHFPHPRPVQSCIPKFTCIPPLCIFLPHFSLSTSFSPSMLQCFPPFPTQTGLIHPHPQKSHPQTTGQGGQVSPTATELLCWGLNPHPGVFYDPGWEFWAGWVHTASAKPQSSVSDSSALAQHSPASVSCHFGAERSSAPLAMRAEGAARDPKPQTPSQLIYLRFKRNLKTTRCRKQLKPRRRIHPGAPACATARASSNLPPLASGSG